MKRFTIPAVIVASAALLNACGDSIGPVDTTLDPAFAHTGPNVTPTELSGNPTCESAGFTGSIDIKLDDPPANGSLNLPGGFTVNFTVTGGKYLAFDSDIPLDGVLVKGGNAANMYDYRPGGEDHDNGLHSPDNSSGGPADISHFNVCFTPRLAISKTAVTSYDRTHEWDIEKSADRTSLELNPGTQAQVNYTVTVSYLGYDDSGHEVNGTVTISNPWGNAATISAIGDVITPGAHNVTLDCGVAFPYVLAAGADLECDYSYEGDGTETLNTVTVTTTAGPAGGVATAAISWGAPASHTDACIDVYDKMGDAAAVLLGTACHDDAAIVANGEKEFEFAWNGSFGSEDCDGTELVNVAYFDLEDESRISDTWTVDVTLDCTGGCTLSQGYWRTHSSYGPAPEDQSSAWDIVGVNTTFYLSIHSWYGVMHVPPQGNAYYQLATQFVAATLNGHAGADQSAVAAAMAQAHALFSTYTPAQIGQLKGNNSVRKNFIDLAGQLGAFNTGVTGPGYCNSGTN